MKPQNCTYHDPDNNVTAIVFKSSPYTMGTTSRVEVVYHDTGRVVKEVFSTLGRADAYAWRMAGKEVF